MPTTETKLRRGTATQCDAFTGAEAEVVVDTTNDRLRVHDGIKVGGFHIPNHKDVQQQVFNYGTVGGSANAITLTSSTNAAITAYALPLKLTFKATATNSGATTVNVDGLGAKNIYQVLGGAVVALTGGEIVNGGIYDITYDGTQFQLTNSAGSSGGANVQEFTSSGTWTKPSGYSPDARVLMQAIAGGGAGGNSGTTGASGGNTTISSWILAGGGGGGTSGGVGGAGGKGSVQHGGSGGAVNANGGNAGNAGGGGGGSGTGLGGTGVTGGLGGAGGNAGNAGSTYGGGGGGDSTGGGGGGGGYSERWARLGDMSATESITIGAGAAGGVRSGANGYARITVFS